MSELDEELRAGEPRRVPVLVWPVLIAVVVAGLAGYQIGHAHRGAAPRATTTATVTAAPATDSRFSAVLDLGDDRCSSQSGHHLQLGLQLLNPGGATATVQDVTPVYPLGGLRTVSVHSGPCAVLHDDAPVSIRVGTDRLEWITVTVDVRVRCPQPLPVQLDVRYTSLGREHDVHLPAFPDLGAVPYSGCRG